VFRIGWAGGRCSILQRNQNARNLLPSGITYPQAKLIFGGKVFRAECIAAPMSRDDAANMQMAQERRESSDFQ
jgi:hypothetical protein